VKRFPWLPLLAAVCFSTTPLQAADSRADFLKLIDRKKVEPAPKEESSVITNGRTLIHFSFAAEADQRVPGLLLKATNSEGRRPVVIVLHGTGGSKQGMLPLLRKFSDNGFVAIAIDGRYHGERANGSRGQTAYDDAIVRAWRGSGEHPFFYDTVWDVMRLVDYLEKRADVDAKRIGLMGISKGGIETYLTAAVDPRIAAAVPCIGVQSFRWALEHDSWKPRIGTIQKAFDTAAKEDDVAAPDAAFVRKFYDRVAPGIYGEFDCPAMLPYIAPRPMLVINGDSDDRTPLPGLKECTDAADTAYRAAGAAEQFSVRLQEKTGHTVRPESENAAVDWFARWLKP
jgi:dienelactone hydrolase